MQSEKICAESATKNTLYTPQFIWPIGPISQNIIWNVFEKRPYWASVVCDKEDVSTSW